MKIVYILALLIIISSFSYSFFFKKDSIDISNLSKSFYDYSAESISGDTINMSDYKGKKVLIVNVASKCGYTYQYEQLQDLYSKYSDKIVVLGFPSNDFLFQEPGNNQSIQKFCTTKFGVTFPMFGKTVVKKNKNQHPLYSWLSHIDLNNRYDDAPSWNFCKYLIDEKGELIDYFNSKVSPLDDKIIKLIQ